jgi:hypothetical protein
LLQLRLEPYRRCILMWAHRSIWCSTVVLLVELVMNFYCLMFVLLTVSVIVQYSLTSLYGRKHESIIDLVRPNGRHHGSEVSFCLIRLILRLGNFNNLVSVCKRFYRNNFSFEVERTFIHAHTHKGTELLFSRINTETISHNVGIYYRNSQCLAFFVAD